ncbi:MAG: substrate binding domain-containing protein [Filomicrobium sp.]
MEPSGTLRFAASSTFAQLYVAPLLPEFLELHPGISLDLRFTDLQLDLIEGSFDLALRNSTLADSSLKARKLADDHRVLCASPGYLEKYGTPSDPNDLHDHQLIAFRNQLARELIGPGGPAGQFDPRNANCRIVVDDGASMRIATVSGAGISMNGLWSVHREIKDGELVRVLPDYVVDHHAALWLVYPKSNVLTAKVRVLIDFLLERIGRSPPWLREL